MLGVLAIVSAVFAFREGSWRTPFKLVDQKEHLVLVGLGLLAVAAGVLGAWSGFELAFGEEGRGLVAGAVGLIAGAWTNSKEVRTRLEDARRSELVSQ